MTACGRSGRGHAIDSGALGVDPEVGRDGAGCAEEGGKLCGQAGAWFDVDVTPTGCCLACRQWAHVAMDTCDSKHKVLIFLF